LMKRADLLCFRADLAPCMEPPPPKRQRRSERGPCAARTRACYDALGKMDGKTFLTGKPGSEHPGMPICRAPGCMKAGGHWKSRASTKQPTAIAARLPIYGGVAVTALLSTGGRLAPPAAAPPVRRPDDGGGGELTESRYDGTGPQVQTVSHRVARRRLPTNHLQTGCRQMKVVHYHHRQFRCRLVPCAITEASASAGASFGVAFCAFAVLIGVPCSSSSSRRSQRTGSLRADKGRTRGAGPSRASERPKPYPSSHSLHRTCNRRWAVSRTMRAGMRVDAPQIRSVAGVGHADATGVSVGV
jgi:hypothetical protein